MDQCNAPLYLAVPAIRESLFTKKNPRDTAVFLFSINKQPVRFSFFPVVTHSDRVQLNSTLYTATPWALVNRLLTQAAADVDRRKAVTAFLVQGQEFFEAAHASTLQGAQPLLYYYAFMNLAKAIVVAYEKADATSKFSHGLSTRDGYVNNFNEACRISVDSDVDDRQSVFSRFAKWAAPEFNLPKVFSLGSVAAQCLIGHQLWCMATAAEPRFIRIRRVEFGGCTMPDERRGIQLSGMLRMRERPENFSVERDRLRRMGFDSGFDCIPKRHAGAAGENMVLISTSTKVDETSSNGDFESIEALVSMWRPLLWRLVTARSDAYREYYVYDAVEGDQRYPQLLGMYVLMFYLGSITRYQPSKLHDLAEGPFGPFVHEYLATIPIQYLFLLASEIAKQEVVNAAKI